MNEGTVDWTTAVVVGALVGWLAERFMHTDVHPIVNIATAIAGALLLNLVLGWFGFSMGGWFGFLIKGFVGACILLVPVMLFRRHMNPHAPDEWD